MDVLLFTTIPEHCRQTLHTAHTTPKTRSDLRRVNILIEFIRVIDTSHDESFGSADKAHKSGVIGLGDNVGRDTVTTSIPTSGQLTGNESTEGDSLGDEDTSSLLEANEPPPGP